MKVLSEIKSGSDLKLDSKLWASHIPDLSGQNYIINTHLDYILKISPNGSESLSLYGIIAKTGPMTYAKNMNRLIISDSNEGSYFVFSTNSEIAEEQDEIIQFKFASKKPRKIYEEEQIETKKQSLSKPKAQPKKKTKQPKSGVRLEIDD